MESVVLYEERKKINISHDRGGVRITVSTPVSPSEIKEKHAVVADVADNVYIPSEITQEAKAYSFYIRKRQTVKDFLIQNECTISDLVSLIKSVNEILQLADRLHLNRYDFIFDYSCIFTGQTLDTAEFVYAPGADLDREQNSISNMLLIASLHVACDENSQEAVALKEATGIIIEWEASGTSPFPFEEVLAVLDVEEKNEGIFFTTWKPFLCFQFIMLLVFIFIVSLVPFRENGVFIWIAFVLLTVCVDYLLIPGKKKNKPEFKLLRRKVLRGMGGLKGKIIYVDWDTIKIGRDAEWADVVISNIFVSRKHAILYFKDNILYVKDLSSRNGTFLNGVRLEANVEVVVEAGSTVVFGHDSVIIKYCYF
ncbi:MAG TPA: FHA domain-containing protein [Clostridiaceae bacterium]|jgi:hypothetical protein|nr:FHA domain-containing protein [Clostridiaceae bacterium]